MTRDLERKCFLVMCVHHLPVLIILSLGVKGGVRSGGGVGGREGGLSLVVEIDWLTRCPP